ncbi:MAG: PilZ domain-containing protein [Spirochaetes bacterium]|nr:PilZ domain-containing protein [Spirochaetota bacterium]
MAQKIITDYGEIVSIIKICKLYSLRFNIVFDNNSIGGVISDISEFVISLKTDSEIPSSVKSLDISFQLNKDPYHFRAEVVKVSGKDISILIPSQLEIWVPRKYERSYCFGKVFCNINIIKELSGELRSRAQNIPARLSSVFSEVSRDVPNISLVMKMIKDEVASISDIGEVFLHKQGENLPLPVVIVSRYRKPILLEDTQDEKSYYKRYLGNEVISFCKFMEDLNWDTDRISREVNKFMLFFANNNIKSITYVPIFLFENVVGHIRVASFLDKISKVLSLRDVYYIQSLSDILSEALAKYKLFSLSSNSEFPIPVYDISLGGAKIEIEQYLSKFLEPGVKVKINIKFDDGKILTLRGKVLRIDTEEDKLFAAIQFEDISKIDETIISDFVTKNNK